MAQFPVIRSKTGVPCLWEQGGGNTNTGDAVLVTNKHGGAKSPLYIKTRGSLACGNHALIPVSVGDHVITAAHHRKDFSIEVFQIIDITDNLVIAIAINYFDCGEWDATLDPSFANAVESAQQKAACYHCREPHYIRVSRNSRDAW